MHPAAFEFVGRYATSDAISVIEIGSRNINGTVRDHFPGATWTGLDLYPGPAVDVVIDSLNYTPAEPVDLVICCEVLEHAPKWKEIVRHSAKWLKVGGRILITCAGPDRVPHSAIDGGQLRRGEYYANVSQEDLAEELYVAGFTRIDVSSNTKTKDTYGTAMLLAAIG